MKTPTILLADNGSKRADSVINLRRLAKQLSNLSNHQVFPVSLQHADKIPTELLNGEAAEILTTFLSDKLKQGETEFILIPLFFGRSLALTSFIPQQLEKLRAEYGPFKLTLAEELYPLPQGEPRVAMILHQQLQITNQGRPPQLVILVDHGSPLPEVSEVRKRVCADLRQQLAPGIELQQAVMERRKGNEYDFNGQLLSEQLEKIARSRPNIRIDLALLFLSPGRHAGAGGDIESICQKLSGSHPGVRIRIAPLVGQHPGIGEILLDRLDSALDNPV
ncbi:MAG: cobalamin biosynthesis protein CbiX [Candidatus Thiodiazotropha sp. (ex. Lucinisca nassula)]|nr:cobalamin biosynthesis protein CbiX [Candidatus Thiodiazotropha sp. (ex. Lucinisca nassula)]MBW9269847.1 cobalamin biosynthesis protein CbiX [Candidatus Thiodiazotropha sp. (ex. Lucinisca nassula)]